MWNSLFSRFSRTRPAQRLGVALRDFLALAYGANPNLDDKTVLTIRKLLRKDTVDSLADVRAILMALDRQVFPTPMMVRFSAGDIKSARINGIDCAVDGHDISVSAPGAASGVYEPHLHACLRKLCLPGTVALDIGANVGFHTMMLSKLCAAGHVYAFEPNSENCRLIILSAERNGAANITLFPVALSDRRGWAYFSSHIGSNGGLVSEQFVTGAGTVVPTFTLDEMGLPDVDVIKVDVEGAEYRALKGGARLLARSRPAIVCEFSMEMTQRVSGAAPAEFLGWIEAMDYRLYILDRKSRQSVAMASGAALLEGWGSALRVEDLLFLPREKTALLA